ncbi:MAG: GAF domain-containing protein, partial [Nitrososphaerales archaeon]
MPEDRVLRILAKLRAEKDHALPRRLCEVSVEVLSMTGAGVMLMSGDLARGSLCSSNDVSALIEDLQFTLGEGPCVDAHRSDLPVIEPDLAEPHEARWTIFTPQAVAAGARAVFGFPLQLGAVRLGALNLYRDRPGQLDADQHADAVVMARVVARSIIAMQAEAP